MFLLVEYYRKRGSASYIVREVLSVRERERDTVDSISYVRNFEQLPTQGRLC